MNRFVSVCLLIALAMMVGSCTQSSNAVEDNQPSAAVSTEDMDPGQIPIEPAAKDDKPGAEIILETNGFATNEIYIANYFGNKQYLKDTVQVTGNRAISKM